MGWESHAVNIIIILIEEGQCEDGKIGLDSVGD